MDGRRCGLSEHAAVEHRQSNRRRRAGDQASTGQVGGIPWPAWLIAHLALGGGVG